MFDMYNHLQPLDPRALTPDWDKLSDEEREEVCTTAAATGCASYAVAIILAIVLCALLGSCTTTRYIPVERVRTDTVRITTHERDSIFLRDSIHVREQQSGDTVRIEVERWHTRYQDRWRTDTCYESRVDSVPVPVPVEVAVPTELSAWQKLRMGIGDVLLILLGGGALWWLGKKYIKSRLKI